MAFERVVQRVRAELPRYQVRQGNRPLQVGDIDPTFVNGRAYCYEDMPGERWICTQPVGHRGVHIAHRIPGLVLGIWGVVLPAEVEVAEGL